MDRAPVHRGLRHLVVVVVLAVAAVGASSVASAQTSQVDRIAGRDRYETAAKVSEQFPVGSNVFIATGENFPDSLASGPALGAYQAPLLLVTHDGIPEVTEAALTRLAPASIHVVGGPAAVSDNVVAQLKQFASGDVERLAGADRYGTAIAITQDVIPPNGVIPYLLVVTGRDFPDALFAGALGAFSVAPVLLVDGHAPLNADIINEIQRIAPSVAIVVMGDFNAVTADVEAQLDEIVPTFRISENAYNRGALVWSLVDPGSRDVILVTGANFPDGLAVAGLAGLGGGKITYLVPPNCVPPAVGNELGRIQPAHITLIGGPSALSTDVEHLVRCT